MKNRPTVVVLALCLFLGGLAPLSAEGLPKLKDPRVLFELGQKLVAKGDDGVIAMARIARAMLFAQEKDWQKALAELRTLDGEVRDPEVLFVANGLKIVVLKKAETPREGFLQELQKMVDEAKARRAR